MILAIYLLGCVVACMGFVITMLLADAKSRRAKLGDLYDNNRELREKYLSLIEAETNREALLKRALQDLADAEIDRARFALRVIYGAPPKKH